MNSESQIVEKWASELGYDRIDGSLISASDGPSARHPYAPEVRDILQVGEQIGADAVFCIENVPAVCLIDSTRLAASEDERRSQVRAFCERLWNQNLARIVLVAGGASLEAWSVDNPQAQPTIYRERTLPEAARTWSVAGLFSGLALKGRDEWFAPDRRVDKTLLDNILNLVQELIASGLKPSLARLLVARVIFIAYLEDRGIVGDVYRKRRGVKGLIEMIRTRDVPGLQSFVGYLRDDFNGDFLSSDDLGSEWAELNRDAFAAIYDFLENTVLRTGQRTLWRYDFSHIPIELIAGIYETFLAMKDRDGTGASPKGAATIQAESQDTRSNGKQPALKASEKRKLGAYYTPRLLADWVVNLAAEGRDITRDRIFDGACGSGMLLTAAFKRLVREYEANAGDGANPAHADFKTRSRLLTDHIFGGDVDADACQLTAFSLYLALLSDLTPADLATLREGGHQLPSLNENIRRGEEGDFFSAKSSSVNASKYTLFLSNPPWRKVSAGSDQAIAMDNWIGRQFEPKPHIPKNQIAAAFALGAFDCLAPGGRIAFILPVTSFVSVEETERRFRAHLLGRYEIEKVVNFSDMRRLIFADAVHPFVVLTAKARPRAELFSDTRHETFQYWTPKTDISLAFGQIVVHAADITELSASTFIGREPVLKMRYWGSRADVVLFERLRRIGTVRDLVRSHGWLDAKGFHAKDEDKRRHPESWYVDAPSWMKEGRFLPALELPSQLPFVPPHKLTEFPLSQIARIIPRRLCEGPRVIWTDGAHPTTGVKAIFTTAPFSFQHSLAVLSAPDDEDSRLTARFLAAYLRSPMGLWLLLLTSSSVASERPKLHVAEAIDWPFWPLSQHPSPDDARAIMREIDCLIDSAESTEVEASNLFGESSRNDRDQVLEARWKNIQPTVNKLVFDYFALSDHEIALVAELANHTGSGIQPARVTHRALSHGLRLPPTPYRMTEYCQALAGALETWRDATGGEGRVTAVPWSGESVPLGAAVLSLNASGDSRRIADDSIVNELVHTLHNALSDRTKPLGRMPEVTVLQDGKIYLMKPLIARFWLRRNAIEDAAEIAVQLQALARAEVT